MVLGTHYELEGTPKALATVCECLLEMGYWFKVGMINRLEFNIEKDCWLTIEALQEMALRKSKRAHFEVCVQRPMYDADIRC